MDQAAQKPRTDAWWILALFLISGAWCVSSARQIGATFDEPIYLARGLESWRTGSHRGLIRLGTMPLPADVQTLPLYVAERLQGHPWDLERDFARLLPWARGMNLLFWGLLLIFAYRLAASLSGPWAGRLAVLLLACEPNLLAHASLATTDIPLAACLLAFVFYYRRGRDAHDTFTRIVMPGFWLGIALLAKASTLVFGPLCMIAIELEHRLRAGAFRAEANPWTRRLLSSARVFVSESARIGLIALVVLLLGCGCDWQPEPSFVAWARERPEGASRTLWLGFAEHLRIFSNGLEGLVRQVKHNMKGHGTYLFGEAREQAFWYYFPVLLTIKLTVPFLLGMAALAVRRPRGWANAALVMGLVLAAFSLTYRVQLGIRMMLPCIALLGIGLASALVAWHDALPSPRGRRILAGATLAGAGGMALASALAWPDGLQFINRLWGGREHGYRLVSDSNYDWGQGLPDLQRWQTRHRDPELLVWYFGTDPAIQSLRELPLHTQSLTREDEVWAQLAGHRVAVGTSILFNHGLTESHRLAAHVLRQQTPSERTRTFFIYDFRALDPALARQRDPAGSVTPR